MTQLKAKQDSAWLPSLHPAEVVLGVYHVVLWPFRRISPCSAGCHSLWDGCPSSHPTLAVCAQLSLRSPHPFLLGHAAVELLVCNQLSQESEKEERETEDRQINTTREPGSALSTASCPGLAQMARTRLLLNVRHCATAASRDASRSFHRSQDHRGGLHKWILFGERILAKCPTIPSSKQKQTNKINPSPNPTPSAKIT